MSRIPSALLQGWRDREDEPVLPLTALIDVLFLIIIFLVLGANFDQVETIRLPEAKGGVESGQMALRLEMRAGGDLWLEGRPLPDAEVLSLLRERAPPSVLLLPDRQAPVGALIGWYDRITQALKVPVQVGVQSPPTSGAP